MFRCQLRQRGDEGSRLSATQQCSMDCKCDCGNLDVEYIGRCRTVCAGWDARCEAIGRPSEDETSAGSRLAGKQASSSEEHDSREEKLRTLQTARPQPQHQILPRPRPRFHFPSLQSTPHLRRARKGSSVGRERCCAHCSQAQQD